MREQAIAMGEKMSGTETKEEYYRWLGAIDVNGQKVRLYVEIRFVNDILDLMEFEFIVDRQGYPFRESKIRLERDDPSEYAEIVIIILKELLERIKVIEESYSYYIRF